MSHGLRLKRKSCREARTDASVAVSGARCMETGSDAGATSPSMQRQSQGHNIKIKGRRQTKLDADIKRIQNHYDEQEKVLEKELAKVERRYEWAIAELEREGQDEYHFVDECDAQSDYQPTECGEGSGSLMQ